MIQYRHAGVNDFYDGPIANAMIQALQAQNGTMTPEDLQYYTAVTRTPASITYPDYKLTACSTSSRGGVVLSKMKRIECYSDVEDSSILNLSTHRLKRQGLHKRYATGRSGENDGFILIRFREPILETRSSCLD